MSKLGVGVVGVGEMGQRHAENLRHRVPGCRLVAVADVDGARASRVAAELEIEHSYSSVPEMLERKDIQAVVIATPDRFHAQAIQTAAAAGKHILCEKPIAVSVQDARAALSAVKKAGVLLQIGFMRRYDPGYVAAKQRIEAGEIGQPVIFKSVGRDKDAPPLAYYRANLNGMVFYNNSIHDFDLARWLMGDEVAQVQAYTTCCIRPEVADYSDIVAGVVNLKFVHGAVGNIESYVQCVYGYDVRTEIVGSKGSVFVGTLQKTPAVFLSANGSTEAVAEHFLSRFADAYLSEVRDFVHAISTGASASVSGDDGMKALEIAVAAERSHQQGRPCSIDDAIRGTVAEAEMARSGR
jgi:inositol 2-dehydrogenase